MRAYSSPGSATIREKPQRVRGRPLAGRLAVDAARGRHAARRATSTPSTNRAARPEEEVDLAGDPLLRGQQQRLDVAADRIEVLPLVHQVAVGPRETVSLMRCWRPVSTSFSSSRCAVSSTSAAGASKATRPLVPMMVSPRWMPRPMPKARRQPPRASRSARPARAPRRRGGRAAPLEGRACGAPARAAASKAPRVSTQADSGMLPGDRVSVSLPPIVTPQSPRLIE